MNHENFDASAGRRKKLRGRLAAAPGTKLDLVRNLVVVLDLTKSMADSDFRVDKYPNRGSVAIRAIKEMVIFLNLEIFCLSITVQVSEELI